MNPAPLDAPSTATDALEAEASRLALLGRPLWILGAASACREACVLSIPQTVMNPLVSEVIMVLLSGGTVTAQRDSPWGVV